MKNCYVDEEHISIADLCDYYGKGLVITRINVPSQYRGNGYGSALLKQIVKDADTDRVSLFLEILPSGGLNYTQLKSWYGRYGFQPWNGIMRRVPRKLEEVR